jgi:hypothetical protein
MHGGSTLRRRVALAVLCFARHAHQSIRRVERKQAHVSCFPDCSLEGIVQIVGQRRVNGRSINHWMQALSSHKTGALDSRNVLAPGSVANLNVFLMSPVRLQPDVLAT